MGPTILTLPYAFKGLGWGLGFICLTVMGMVTLYAYYLMSKVLDYCEKDGRRHIRFRELAADVLGNYRNGKIKSCWFRFVLVNTKRAVRNDGKSLKRCFQEQRNLRVPMIYVVLL